MLKNLSRPASVAVSPSARRSARNGVLSRASMILPPPEQSRYRDGSDNPGCCHLLPGCYSVRVRMPAEPAVVARFSAFSDEEIVARVLDGETPLFEVLMRRHNERVYRAARAIIRDDHEAEDV